MLLNPIFNVKNSGAGHNIIYDYKYLLLIMYLKIINYYKFISTINSSVIYYMNATQFLNIFPGLIAMLFIVKTFVHQYCFVDFPQYSNQYNVIL